MRLRRELLEAGVRVWETRSLADCWEMLALAPASFVVAELTAENAAGLLCRMARSERDLPAARFAVVADRSVAEYRWMAHEAGAVYVSCSPRQLGPLARIACRHLAAMPPPTRSLAERIWESLPWPRAAEQRSE